MTVWILQELELGFIAAWSTREACTESFPGEWQERRITGPDGSTHIAYMMREIDSQGTTCFYRLHEAKIYTEPLPN